MSLTVVKSTFIDGALLALRNENSLECLQKERENVDERLFTHLASVKKMGEKSRRIVEDICCILENLAKSESLLDKPVYKRMVVELQERRDSALCRKLQCERLEKIATDFLKEFSIG